MIQLSWIEFDNKIIRIQSNPIQFKIFLIGLGDRFY